MPVIQNEITDRLKRFLLNQEDIVFNSGSFSGSWGSVDGIDSPAIVYRVGRSSTYVSGSFLIGYYNDSVYLIRVIGVTSDNTFNGREYTQNGIVSFPSVPACLQFYSASNLWDLWDKQKSNTFGFYSFLIVRNMVTGNDHLLAPIDGEWILRPDGYIIGKMFKRN